MKKLDDREIRGKDDFEDVTMISQMIQMMKKTDEMTSEGNEKKN